MTYRCECECIGWRPSGDKSMIDSLRWPSAMPASRSSQTSASSGPRWARLSVMHWRDAALSVSLGPRNPVMPHISKVRSRVEGLASRLQPQESASRFARGGVATHLVVAHPFVHRVARRHLRDDEPAPAVHEA